MRFFWFFVNILSVYCNFKYTVYLLDDNLECLNAKEQGLYIDKLDWGKFGDRRMIPTGESIVFLSEDGTTFTKMKSPFAKASMKVGGWKAT